MYACTTATVEETQQLAATLVSLLCAGDVVVLNGDLGAGKTHFVQGAARALGVEQPVTSPTFNILQVYPILPHGKEAGCVAPGESAPSAINHFDLYRLDEPGELDDIGYWEVLENGGVSFVEWGDKFPDEMPDDYLELQFTADTAGVRTIAARAHGLRSSQLLDAWYTMT
ncbi:MAG: tRNA (adenosine(37)-N6)-threonylcarbamoyltransferase complex ATPase subunit type 1 TsaE [Eggerthellaceae bacterium]|nr:tRNA (adenosine(37)-N6)-threonylcarbamoyltransferase complex ATPase subunit type 1 TsaE [Eggerthellaceae bacterium]